jgi:hypothetical protein
VQQVELTQAHHHQPTGGAFNYTRVTRMSQEQEVEPTQQVVLQRIRNRIIEYLELASSFGDQRNYQSIAPVNVGNEIINQWEDLVRDPRDPAFVAPVFSAAEQESVAQFHNVWNAVAANTPDPVPELDSLFATAEWQRLRAAALLALRVFLARGKLSEDREHGRLV